MKIKNYCVISLAMLIPLLSTGQMFSYIEKLPHLPQQEKNSYSKKERMELLHELLSSGERVEFEEENYYDTDETNYYPLDTLGLHFIDLDTDGDLDLLYSSKSGSLTLVDTKLYFNDNSQLHYDTLLMGGIRKVESSKDKYTIYTFWQPCCDSYTSKIRKYSISQNRHVILEETISIIGSPRIYEKVPDFDHGEPETALTLYASQDDFRNVSPWFRERNKEVKDSLSFGHFVELIQFQDSVSVTILANKKVNSQEWDLVITEPLTDLPKSLYEWVDQGRHRLVGWARKD